MPCFARLTVCLAALMPAPAAAFSVLAPPVEYQHPYQGELTLQHGSPRKVDDMCRVTGQIGRGPVACAYMENLSQGRCTVWMPNLGAVLSRGTVVTPALYEKLLLHETAHCNGWPVNHRVRQ